MPHVFFRNPRRMTFDLETEVALLEQNGCAVAAQHRIAQPRLEPVPAGRQRAGDIADIFVIHAQERAEAVLFHHRASPLGAVFSQPVPVDALLPIHSGDAEIRSHLILPRADSYGLTSVGKIVSAQALRCYSTMDRLTVMRHTEASLSI